MNRLNLRFLLNNKMHVKVYELTHTAKQLKVCKVKLYTNSIFLYNNNNSNNTHLQRTVRDLQSFCA